MDKNGILFPFGKPKIRVSDSVLKDLRIDNVLKKLSNGPDDLEYETCYLPLTDLETVHYRHEIFRDFTDTDFVNALENFQSVMDGLCNLSENIKKISNLHMKELYLVESAVVFCKTIRMLHEAFQKSEISSTGFLSVRDYLNEYVSSEIFLHLEEHSGNTSGKVHSLKYILHVKDNQIYVGLYEKENELGKEIREFFQPLLGDRMPEQISLQSSSWELNTIQAEVLKCLEKLDPKPFSSLAHFMRSHSEFIPKELTLFHQDLGFYLIWKDYYLPLKQAGLSFSLPDFAGENESIFFRDCFDLILADKCTKNNEPVVTNDLSLDPKERILVLTGPNQGGKTTYSRMLGQLFYLASLGIPVPGSSARLFLPDRIFTHFERQESQLTLNGKLRDDMIRIHDILGEATGNSLILINEMFASTTLVDASWLGKKILELIREKGSFCLYVTFINALSTAFPEIVSLISEIGEDQESRTYKITRGSADGRAYAQSIVKKYQLTYDNILERIGE